MAESSTKQMTEADKLKKLNELIDSIKTCMFTTSDEATGRLHSRPMYVQGNLENGHLYFFTADDSAKVGDFRQESQVNCGFANPSKQQYVSAAGKARLTRDRALMEAKWSAPLVSWFPQGLDTPHLGLIDVTVSDAQYWDSNPSLVIHAYGMVKAALTGQPVTSEAGENEKLTVSADKGGRGSKAKK